MLWYWVAVCCRCLVSVLSVLTSWLVVIVGCTAFRLPLFVFFESCFYSLPGLMDHFGVTRSGTQLVCVYFQISTDVNSYDFCRLRCLRTSVSSVVCRLSALLLVGLARFVDVFSRRLLRGRTK